MHLYRHLVAQRGVYGRFTVSPFYFEGNIRGAGLSIQIPLHQHRRSMEHALVGDRTWEDPSGLPISPMGGPADRTPSWADGFTMLSSSGTSSMERRASW